MSTPSGPPAITLFRGFKEPGAFVWSPFVTKLEARLRFSGLPYAAGVGSPRQAPKGKVPYVEIATGGGPGGTTKTTTTLADSTLIVAALCADGVLSDLAAPLSKVERAHDLALRALLEDKLSFYHAWERWMQNFYTMRDHVLWPISWPLRVLVGAIIHRNMVATLHGQGTGRFDADEIAAFRREIWSSFADLLLESRAKQARTADDDDDDDEGRPFWVLGHPEPTDADATLFGFIVSTLLATAGPGSQADVKSFPVLLEYARRIRERYFPDYEALPA
ncbi:hypothetical protein F5Y14DRAFT_255659 [Nemania sp. NC0429]|nr:hypothetical protein F5Y14DRAFT_255659 [Nemania sp. NC0429]